MLEQSKGENEEVSSEIKGNWKAGCRALKTPVRTWAASLSELGMLEDFYKQSSLMV